jgi:hypothetical protein
MMQSAGIKGDKKQPVHMRRAVLLMVVLSLLALCLPVAGAPFATPPPKPGITITATPSSAHVGDTIVLNGTVTGINTIAVYLFVTGPDLDPRGVSLENLNIAAGRGLFTTAPVHMDDGSWSYAWDTSVIIGNLKPGNYSVYVVGSPLDRLRSNPQETAVTQVSFAPSENPSSETPLPPVLPVAAVLIAGVLFCAVRLNRK